MKRSENTQNLAIETLTIDDELKQWQANLLNRNNRLNNEAIGYALNLLAFVPQNKTNMYGESCWHNGLAMAEIVNDLSVGTDAVIASLLYSSVQHGGLSLDNIQEHLGTNVAKLIKSTIEFGGIDKFYIELKQTQQHFYNIDNIRKMFLAIVDDVVAILIKLAERLQALRFATKLLKNNHPNAQTLQIQIARSVTDLYAPLANRLGISQLKWEMEDLAFRYIEPKIYYDISHFLNENRVSREKYIIDFIDNLTTLLQKSNIKNFNVTGRVKHIYSIYRKMQRKKTTLDNINDINAVRIFVPEVVDCYEVLSLVHNTWNYLSHEFDDYVANPKPNGYSSIHTAIVGPNNKIVEIQIRTYNMHDQAELGVAAHWLYKEGQVKTKINYEEKISLLRQVMDWQEEIADNEDKRQEVQKIFKDRVYVFTPQDDLLDLPTGSTPLDFAYRVHTEVGNRCVGAKINGAIVALNYKLKTSDRIEILTGKRSQPSRDWLNAELGFLHTAHARAKVLGWFKKQFYDNNLKLGIEILHKEIKRLGFGFNSINYEHLVKKLNYSNKNDLLVALGNKELKLSNVINIINQENTKNQEIKSLDKSIDSLENNIQENLAFNIKTEHEHKNQNKTIKGIEVQGVNNLLTHIANCCKPMPGDKIIGYVTQGKGIAIHRSDCKNILRASNLYPEKLITVSWGSNQKQKYAVDLVIEAQEQINLMRNTNDVLQNLEIKLLGLQYNVDKKSHLGRIYLTVEISDLELLQKLLRYLQNIHGVTQVWRV